jgi:hypothetical protein
MSIETKAKALVALKKREAKLVKQLENLREEIRTEKEAFSDVFKKLGLNANFSS